VDLTEIAARIWHESEPASGTLVERYLHGRCITIPIPDTIRFHPAVYHRESGTYAAAMIAIVQNAIGEKEAIHRTWLDPVTAGKADLDPMRKALGPIDHLAVHLGEPGDELVLAEGIETALSAMQLYQIPAWATLSSFRLRIVILPRHIRRIVIAADNDLIGMRDARLTRERLRLEHPQVELIVPDRSGEDFNDVLRQVSGARA
jgi:hypothetical protein